ncbi:hypothetical protein EYZ11_006445 [Aspergillus tanneri]|uniref:Uncharacterized protein n=1 Tax=Aspergillus tanneri TaxID=1220188 RepID=A0A4S3JG13_9EURO|nr:uncharacterized protein ATNIH1004_010974 [Aspergillus tanneri]KAA8642034.1 hypothetical protein ATNIH1004_010974 [Aspergillus tanneri]THC94075.1 hypothetical protein EYZ11_006445 [Aspergillus tanneri]
MVAKLVLPALCLSVFYAIFYFGEINGLHRLALQSIESKTLPGSNQPLRTTYTGVEKLDELLTALTVFFWPTTDGNNEALTLHSLGFSGTFGSAWVLVTLESWRRGNIWTLPAFPAIFGLTAQVLTFAFATPLYCFVQLLSSISVRKPTPDNIRIPRAVLNAIPFVFIIGYIVPSTLMILPESEHVTADLKQIFIAIWQPWPAYVAILLTIANVLFSPFVSNDYSIEGGRATLRALRRVYAFAFANAAISHLVSWIVSLATVAAPALFEERFRTTLHPLNVYDIPLPWASPALQVQSVGQGVHAFLRWDYLIGSAGVLVWAISLYKSAHLSVYGKVGWFGLVVKTALLTVFAGPVGTAVELIWERDELVFNELGGLKREASKQKKTS